MEIEISGSPDFGKLEAEWRRLETEAPGHSFFQGWTWLGCLAAERFTDPVLIRGHAGGRTVGLALFNRRGGTLSLAETGEATQDSVFIEHNGPLVGTAAEEGAREGAAGLLLLRAAWQVRGIGRIVLSGVPPALTREVGGVVASSLTRPAPHVDLTLPGGAGAYMASRSTNTRAQLRRSLRHFGRAGPLAVSRAEEVATARAWLGEMMALHGERWQRAGGEGAFAAAPVRRFHEALAERALARGELDLLRIAAGGELLGFLYGFRHRGTVHAYQSGFRHFAGENDARPGLVAHFLAIEAARAAGLLRYDFLAGAARYKLSLATGTTDLAWETRVAAASPAAAVAVLRGVARRLRGWVRDR